MKTMSLKNGEVLVLCVYKPRITLFKDFGVLREESSFKSNTGSLPTGGYPWHGFLWGEGDFSLDAYNDEDQWLVCKVIETDCVKRGGNVVFSQGTVVFLGSQSKCIEFIVKYSPSDVRCNLAMQNALINRKAVQLAGNNASQNAGKYAEQTSGSNSLQVAGSASTQITGDNSVQTSDISSTQISGNNSIQTGDNFCFQRSGHASIQTAGKEAQQEAGDNAIQTAGAKSIQKAGKKARQTAGHDSTQSAGENSVLFAGVGSKCRAGTGSIIKLCYRDKSGKIQLRMAEISENGPFRPGVFYCLDEGGKFVKAVEQQFSQCSY